MKYEITTTDLLGKEHTFLWDPHGANEEYIRKLIHHIQTGQESTFTMRPVYLAKVLCLAMMTVTEHYWNGPLLRFSNALVRKAKESQPELLSQMRTVRHVVHSLCYGTEAEMASGKALLFHALLTTNAVTLTGIAPVKAQQCPEDLPQL